MSLKTSTNGKVLYIYNAGNTIDLYEADTFKFMKHDHARRRRHLGSVRRSGRSVDAQVHLVATTCFR